MASSNSDQQLVKFLNEITSIILKYPVVSTYTRYFDRVINNGLRNGKLSTTGNSIHCHISTLYKILPKLPHKITVYRGINNVDNYIDLSVGNKFIEPGYFSTTLNKSIGQGFIDVTRCSTYKDCILFVLTLPIDSFLLDKDNKPIKSCKVKVINFNLKTGLSMNEEEILLQSGGVFEIIDITDYMFNNTLIKLVNINLIGFKSISYTVDSNIDDGYYSLLSTITDDSLNNRAFYIWRSIGPGYRPSVILPKFVTQFEDDNYYFNYMWPQWLNLDLNDIHKPISLLDPSQYSKPEDYKAQMEYKTQMYAMSFYSSYIRGWLDLKRYPLDVIDITKYMDYDEPDMFDIDDPDDFIEEYMDEYILKLIEKSNKITSNND